MSAAANSPPTAAPALFVQLAFDPGNQLAVRRAGTRLGLAFVGPSAEVAGQRLKVHFQNHTPPAEYFTA